MAPLRPDPAVNLPPSHLRPARADDVSAALDLWRRADASPSSTESAADVHGLLERDPDALILAGRAVRSSAR
jgi:hypothetical protein